MRKNSKKNFCINTNREYTDSKYNGFTLIELLAIIVILAIIAVITVPIILNIIEDAKQGSVTDSAYGYKNAIQKHSMFLQTRDSNSDGLNGSYTVDELKTLGLEVTGKEPSEGIILVDNEGISGCLKFDEYTTYLYNNQVISTAKGNCPTQKLVTQGDGLYKSTTEPGRLIYRGADPDNRIFLKEDGTNDVLYRIVSYETDGTIKVVRDERILKGGANTIAWDTKNIRIGDSNTYCSSAADYGCNVWGNQTNTLYNGTSLGDSFHYSYYASASATTLTNGGSGKVGAESTLNIYLNSKIANSGDSWQPAIQLDNYIDNHSWKVGGLYYTSSYKNGDKGIQREKEEESLYTWTGKIGLMNITEFAEASTNTGCDVFTNFGYNAELYYYKDEGASTASIHTPSTGWPCAASNWTFKSGYHQWSLSPNSSYRNGVWHVISAGYFSTNGAGYTYGVRPAFYLKSQINLSGSGISGDEYTIE